MIIFCVKSFQKFHFKFFSTNISIRPHSYYRYQYITLSQFECSFEIAFQEVRTVDEMVYIIIIKVQNSLPFAHSFIGDSHLNKYN